MTSPSTAMVRATFLPQQGAIVDPFGGPKGATLQLPVQDGAATTAQGVALLGADPRLADRHSVAPLQCAGRSTTTSKDCRRWARSHHRQVAVGAGGANATREGLPGLR